MAKRLFFSLLIFFLCNVVFVAPAYAISGCVTIGQFQPLCDLYGGDVDKTVIVRNVYNILLIAATLLSVGFLIWGGIKWIMSGGDKGKVDSARSTITGALVGLIIAFLSFFILSLVTYFFNIDGGQRDTIFTIPQLNTKTPNYPVNGPANGADDGDGNPSGSDKPNGNDSGF